MQMHEKLMQLLIKKELLKMVLILNELIIV